MLKTSSDPPSHHQMNTDDDMWGGSYKKSISTSLEKHRQVIQGELNLRTRKKWETQIKDLEEKLEPMCPGLRPITMSQQDHLLE